MRTYHPSRAPAAQDAIAIPSHSQNGPAPWLTSSLVVGFLCLVATSAHAITTYDIKVIGLTGPDYTGSTGWQFSWVRSVNASGQVAGVSSKYTNAYGGFSAWIYDGSATREIGLYDAVHTSSNGSSSNQMNLVGALNAAGQVVGYAQRYSGTAIRGQSAWFYDGSSTREIGLTDAGHTRGDGTQYNAVAVYAGAGAFNAAGQIAGYASRYNGLTSAGQSAWFYDGNTTQEIGLIDAGHTRSDGHQQNVAYNLSAAGQVVGLADRYNGSSLAGRNAWVFNGSSTQQIGLTSGIHTRGDGYQYAYVRGQNAAGKVAGESIAYGGMTEVGNSAWLYNGGSTQQIGLTGTRHTNSSTATHYNRVIALNDAGHVIGDAVQYDGAVFSGRSAWVYNGSSTQEIGLTDAFHSQSGFQNNYASVLNADGQVAGLAERYLSPTGPVSGTSAWVYDGSSTQEIGLTDATHTREDGYQNNSVNKINALGQVAGSAERFAYYGSLPLGMSAWLYDPLTDMTYNLGIPGTGQTDRAESGVTFLGDDGLALGYYHLFDTNGYQSGTRAFAFTVVDGWNDLGNLVDGGLNAGGWEYLADAYRADGASVIAGNGKLAGINGQAAYLLTPVPEPETWATLLAGLCLVGVAVRRNRV